MAEKKNSRSSKLKESFKNTGRELKQYGKTYAEDIKKAYNLGFQTGWNRAYELPNRFGAVTSAMFGYRNGAKRRLKHDKDTRRMRQQNAKLKLKTT